MDRHLIPFLQVAIDNKTSVIDLRVQEYSFSFRQKIDHCDVIIFFDSRSGCVCMNQVYVGPNDHEDDDDISLDSFIKYIS
jgi:hypothetical protein